MKKSQLSEQKQQELVEQGYTYNENTGCWTKGTQCIQETDEGNFIVGSIEEENFVPAEGTGEFPTIDAAIEHYAVEA
jgi:hypothetical protein